MKQEGVVYRKMAQIKKPNVLKKQLFGTRF